MSLRFVRPLLCAALLLPALSVPVTSAPAPCSPTMMKVKTAAGTVSTNSTVSVAIPNMVIVFTQGGTRPSCVLVRFSAASSVTGGGVSRVAAVLDSVTFAAPAEAQFSGDNVGSVAHSFEFVFPSVAPGSHTLRMLYRVGTGTAFIDERILVVQHAP